MQFTDLAQATSAVPLSFPLILLDATTIATVGDAGSLIAGLTEAQRGNGLWRIAAEMLDIATREPGYIRVATLSLRTALLLDGRIENTDLQQEP